MTEGLRLGSKVKNLRRREGLSQAACAERLGISASYLNLIENNRRPLTAALLIRVAQAFNVSVQEFAAEDDARLATDLMEVFGDPLFEQRDLLAPEVRELAASQPAVSRAVLQLYRAYKSTHDNAAELAARLAAGENMPGPGTTSTMPSEEVSEFIQKHGNHFPALEDAAERLWRDARLERDDLQRGLVGHLERVHGVRLRVVRSNDATGVVRRLDPQRRVLEISEWMPPRSRNFQLAAQVALLEHAELLHALTDDRLLVSDESRALARVALANYFAGAVLMPYAPFLEAARSERYDVELLGHRFRTSFEQVCHRVCAMRRPGAEGVPFHMLRIDVAGNISKRFSASGIHFARYSGACPRWNIFAAFMTPGMIRLQISRMPDGATYFCLARTIARAWGGYHSQHAVQAVGLGCRVEYARELVYSDGIELENPAAVIPVGVTCRMCERTDCEQRAHPSMRHPLRVDENTRRLSFYDPAPAT